MAGLGWAELAMQNVQLNMKYHLFNILMAFNFHLNFFKWINVYLVLGIVKTGDIYFWFLFQCDWTDRKADIKWSLTHPSIQSGVKFVEKN